MLSFDAKLIEFCFLQDSCSYRLNSLLEKQCKLTLLILYSVLDIHQIPLLRVDSVIIVTEQSVSRAEYKMNNLKSLIVGGGHRGHIQQDIHFLWCQSEVLIHLIVKNLGCWPDSDQSINLYQISLNNNNTQAPLFKGGTAKDGGGGRIQLLKKRKKGKRQ